MIVMAMVMKIGTTAGSVNSICSAEITSVVGNGKSLVPGLERERAFIDSLWALETT